MTQAHQALTQAHQALAQPHQALAQPHQALAQPPCVRPLYYKKLQGERLGETTRLGEPWGRMQAWLDYHRLIVFDLTLRTAPEEQFDLR
jgi:hypothetical protein